MKSFDEMYEDPIVLIGIVIVGMLVYTVYLNWGDKNMMSESIFLVDAFWAVIAAAYMAIFGKHIAKYHKED